MYKGAEETFLVSADVYCQNQNNPFQLHINDLLWNGKKGKQASCQKDRERERECVCDFALQENVVGIRCKTAACERADFVVMRTCTLKLFV